MRRWDGVNLHPMMRNGYAGADVTGEFCGRKVRAVAVGWSVSGSFASLRMTARTGNDNGNGKRNGKDEMRGFFASLRMTRNLMRAMTAV